ncbi:beta-1,4-N-acetylgalactosaminyltransferase bre-4-like isoform X2 [Hyposmocoma kahamanoa]|uniref:beta-1,4-N-acetylgalactosaminyltransferase bre-4-like isoform X2 n=1 Tax=Hyposmocoma kahamanoa TaxID=1477025 RepID=UPI000E6D631E|nr:beta-1,4-N-acetylgalactosaminyltransferase bre-4-like isoform X2 [Hyposmocoma kahamanoa]
MHSVAIFVPYRDREEHLAIFLRHIHPFLIKQQLEYGIYVIEQLGNRDFNKGILYNAVFLEVQGLSPAGWDCYVFQDIDLLPLDLRNLYSCPINPRHMSVAVDSLENRLMYRNMFGGVTILSAAQFLEVNGYSNMYWGWGGEDDDMSKRLRHRGYIISRTNASIARYTMLPHKRRRPNPNRIRILRQAINNYLHDGLSNVKYDLVDIVRHHLYTLIQVDVDRYANDTFIVESTTVLPNVTKNVTKNTTTISTTSS